jgi:hypothetical protein
MMLIAGKRALGVLGFCSLFGLPDAVVRDPDLRPHPEILDQPLILQVLACVKCRFLVQTKLCPTDLRSKDLCLEPPVNSYSLSSSFRRTAFLPSMSTPFLL